MGYRRRAAGRQRESAGSDDHSNVVAASGTQGARRPNKAIDFSQLHKREQVKALARLAELCPPAGTGPRTAEIDEEKDVEISRADSVVGAGSDTNDNSPQRPLRRREVLSSGGSSSRAGALEIQLKMPGGSSNAQPDAGQVEAVRPQAAPPTPPPTRTGIVDMLSRQVRWCSYSKSFRTTCQRSDAVLSTCAVCRRTGKGYSGVMLSVQCHRTFCADGTRRANEHTGSSGGVIGRRNPSLSCKVSAADVRFGTLAHTHFTYRMFARANFRLG
jgi:hypothetical protein